MTGFARARFSNRVSSCARWFAFAVVSYMIYIFIFDSRFMSIIIKHITDHRRISSQSRRPSVYGERYMRNDVVISLYARASRKKVSRYVFFLRRSYVYQLKTIKSHKRIGSSFVCLARSGPTTSIQMTVCGGFGCFANFY